MLLSVALPAAALILAIVVAWAALRDTRARVLATAIGVLATILVSLGVQWWTDTGLFAVTSIAPPPVAPPKPEASPTSDDAIRKWLLANRHQVVVEDVTPLLKEYPDLVRKGELMAEILPPQIDSGHKDAVKYALENNPELVDLRLKNDEFNAPTLHYAASTGDIELVKFVLAKFPDRHNSLGGAGESCLQAAIRNRRMKMIEYLTDNFATVVRVKNSANETAIHTALRTRLLWEERKIVKVVSILVAKAPELAHEPNGSGQTPKQILTDLGELFLFPDFAVQLPEVSKLLTQNTPADTANAAGQ